MIFKTNGGGGLNNPPVPNKKKSPIVKKRRFIFARKTIKTSFTHPILQCQIAMRDRGHGVY
jgi:hypothetical protein